MAELETAGDQFEYEVIGRPDGAEIRLSGELDLLTAAKLDEAIAECLAKGSVENLVFDASKLTFMDSSGIASLLRAAAAGAHVSIRNPSRLVREIVVVTGLEDTLHLEESS